MTRYYAIDHGCSYSEHTAEYGFGDYPETLLYFLGAVEASSRREAISKIKKIHKQFSDLKISFSGINGAWLVEEDDLGSFRSVITEEADNRLPPKAQAQHKLGQEILRKLDFGSN